MSIFFKRHILQSEIKRNLAISLPLAGSQLIYASSGFIGTAMVAHLGKDALAASVLVSMVWFTLSVLFFNIFNAVGVLVSQQYGAKNDKVISHIMGQSYVLGLAAIMMLLIILHGVPWLLAFTKQPATVLKLASDYVHAWLWAIPGLVLLIISEQFLAGIGKAKIVLRISCIIVPLEISLIYALIFGKCGLPRCGLAGVGYGFATTYTITIMGLMYLLVYGKAYRKFAVLSGITVLKLPYLRELIRIGVPFGLMSVIEVGAFAIGTIWMGRFGVSMLAAHQMVLQYLGVAITLVFAMSQAVTVRIGHAAGSGDEQGVQVAVYVGMLLNGAVILCIALAFRIFPHYFLALDMNIQAKSNQVLLQHTTSLLSICSVLLICDNFRIIGFGALRGLKDIHFPMYASFICFWLIGLSAAYIFAFVLNMQGSGIWWGLTLGIACGAVLILLRIRYLLRRIDLAKLVEIKV